MKELGHIKNDLEKIYNGIMINEIKKAILRIELWNFLNSGKDFDI